MLAHLAVFLLIMLITCTLTLLICWAYDNDGVEIDAGRARPAVLAFPDRSHKRRFPPVCATLTHPPGRRLTRSDAGRFRQYRKHGVGRI